MTETIVHPPRTVMEVFEMLPEGTLAEVIDNALYIMPSPTPFHQRIVKTLTTDIEIFLRVNPLGEVFVSPLDIYLDETSNAVEPDIIFVSKHNKLMIDRKGLHGVPDLIIEIISPGNEKHDRVKKKSLYEKFGVKEYWIVDPENKQATGYTLQKDGYSSLGEFTGKIRSLLLQQEFNF